MKSSVLSVTTVDLLYAKQDPGTLKWLQVFGFVQFLCLLSNYRWRFTHSIRIIEHLYMTDTETLLIKTKDESKRCETSPFQCGNGRLSGSYIHCRAFCFSVPKQSKGNSIHFLSIRARSTFYTICSCPVSITFCNSWYYSLLSSQINCFHS